MTTEQFGDKIRTQALRVALEFTTRKYEVYPPGEAPIPTPDNFHTFNSFESIEEQGLMLSQTAECYRNIFGSDEKDREGNITWGEGAMCGHGWEHAIPLSWYEEIRKRSYDGDYACEYQMGTNDDGNPVLCGGALELCYPEERVTKKIESELSHGEKPFLTVLMGDEENPVGGVAWGAVCANPQEVADRLRERYEGKEKLWEEIENYLIPVLESRGVGKILFIDEVGIIGKFRRGPDPVRHLIRSGFENAWSETNKALFWTSKRSNIYKLSTAMGFEPVQETSDGLVFLYNSNFTPLLKILQNFSEDQIIAALRMGSRKKKNKVDQVQPEAQPEAKPV